MQTITGIGPRWKKAFGASLTIALLAAVTVVGITLFSSEVLAAWKAQANTEQATLEGLLNFEAPAATVSRLNMEKEEIEKGQAKSDALLAKNWKYTQAPTLLDYLQNPLLIYTEGIELQLIALFFQRIAPNSPLTNFVTNFTKSWLNTANAFLTTTLHITPVPVISPSF